MQQNFSRQSSKSHGSGLILQFFIARISGCSRQASSSIQDLTLVTRSRELQTVHFLPLCCGFVTGATGNFLVAARYFSRLLIYSTRKFIKRQNSVTKQGLRRNSRQHQRPPSAKSHNAKRQCLCKFAFSVNLACAMAKSALASESLVLGLPWSLRRQWSRGCGVDCSETTTQSTLRFLCC